MELGPDFELLLNIEKCESYCLCGDMPFPELPGVIKKPRYGISLLGSPLGPEKKF